MSATCAVKEDHICKSTETSESLTVKAARLADGLEQCVREFLEAGDQNLGDIELEVERQSREVLRTAAEKAAQKKADGTPPLCRFANAN